MMVGRIGLDDAGVDRLYELTSASVAGVATADELRELERLVCTDPDARRRYVRFVYTDANLRLWADFAGGEASTPEAPVTVGSVSRIGRLALAASVLLALGVTLGIVAATLMNGGEPVAPAPASGVGTLIAIDGELFQNEAALSAGDAILDRPLIFEGSYAELRLNSGVRVLLTGRTRTTPGSGSSVELETGQLTAWAPGSVDRFTVHTPRSRVIDLGTEFGVVVSPAGGESVYVFDGTVRCEGALGAGRVLAAGEGVAVSANGAVSRIDRSPGDLANFAVFDAIDRAESASAALLRDPAIVAYYDFETIAPGGRIDNRAAAWGVESALTLLDTGDAVSNWFEPGRFPSATAVRLSGAAGRALADPMWTGATEHHALTAMAWVRLDRRDGYQIVATNWNQRASEADRHGFHFHVLDGRLELLLPDPALEGKYLTYGSVDGAAPVPTDGWVHLAFTAEAGGAVRLYVNGQALEIDRQDYPSDALPVAPQPLMIGGQVVFHSFDGLVDELAVVRRALSGHEVATYFEQTRTPAIGPIPRPASDDIDGRNLKETEP